jgi:hypothetical protein
MASSPKLVNRRKHSRGLKKVFNLIDAQSASKFYPIDCQINSADHTGNVSQEFVAPFDGFIVGLDSVVQVAITTGGTIQLQLNAVNVPGALVTIANADAKGSRKSASFTAVAVSRGDRITLVLTGFATAGAANIQIGMAAN